MEGRSKTGNLRFIQRLYLTEPINGVSDIGQCLSRTREEIAANDGDKSAAVEGAKVGRDRVYLEGIGKYCWYVHYCISFSIGVVHLEGIVARHSSGQTAPNQRIIY